MKRDRSLWWHDPSLLAVLVVVPTALAAYVTSRASYISAWRVDKFFDTGTLLLIGIALAAFVLGTALGSGGATEQRRPWPSFSVHTRRLLSEVFPWLIGAALFGYAVWIANAFRVGLRPRQIIEAVTKQNAIANEGELERLFANIPGITTLTQVGIVAVVVGTLLQITARAAGERVPSWYRWAMGALLALAFARAFLLTERLALIEVVVPIIVLRTAAWRGTNPAKRAVLRFGPLLAVPALLIGFGVFEYSRSWTFFQEQGRTDFSGFVVERLVGYYATSYNNMEIYIEEGREGTLPFFSLEFLRRLPGAEGVSAGLEPTSKEDVFTDLLERKGNREFNSPGGLLGAIADYGPVGGAVFLFISGALIGLAHRDFLRGGLVGALFYPIVFSGVLDLPRVITWSLGRVFPAFIFAGLVAYLASAHARKALAEGGVDEPGPRPLAEAVA